jgi:hypothetical protein
MFLNFHYFLMYPKNLNYRSFHCFLKNPMFRMNR